MKGFRNLTRLGIVGPINDAGLSHVGDIVQLRSLYIPSARHVTDAGMKNLVRLKNLESLRLSRCQITGDGMQYLKQMTRLKTLDVYDTHVDNSGLQQLKGLKKLTFVVAKRTNVTKDGAKRLQQSLPNCKVAYSPRN